MKDKRVIIFIIIVLALFLGFSIYFVFTNIKQSDLITTDTLFLCPSDKEDNNGNTGHLELVKASEEKPEKDVCNGEFAGKYICQGICGYEPRGQYSYVYIDYKSGIAEIYDTKSDNSSDDTFLYDFKNNKQLTPEFYRLFKGYQDNDKRYFFVQQRVKDNYKRGLIDNYGNTIIQFGKYDTMGDGSTSIDGDGEESIRANGVVTVSKNSKYGFVDIKTGKELTKVEYDNYGFSDENISGMIFIGDEIANRNLKLIYVISNNEGKIINFTTGEVIRTLDKVYKFAFPLTEELVLGVEDKKVDILDKNNKSVFKEKLSYTKELSLSWNNKDNHSFDNYDFKEFKIEIRNDSEETIEYIFDIENRILKKL